MTQELKQAITLLQYSSIELHEFLENKAMENPLMQIETPNVEVIDPRYDRVKTTTTTSQADKQSWLEQIAKDNRSLSQYVIGQIDFRQYDQKMKGILMFIINSMDDNGYIHISMQEVSSILSVLLEEAEDALSIIQSLEPAGIGARNLQECILLQIVTDSERNQLASTIVSDYFSLFAKRNGRRSRKNLLLN